MVGVVSAGVPDHVFIIEHLITDNYWATQTAIDDYIPFCEWFIFPYDAWAFLLVAIGLYLIIKDGEGLPAVYVDHYDHLHHCHGCSVPWCPTARTCARR